MKISVPLLTIQKNLSFISHAVSAKSPLPILQNFLLEAANNTITLSATDLEVGIIIKLDAQIGEEGNVTIPARPFIELINSLQEEIITISVDKTICEISTKKTKTTLQTLPADDFPRLHGQKGELLLDIPLKNLKKDFSSVVFSSSNDVARPALSGILFRKEEKGYLLVATDGYRLSLKHLPQRNLTSRKESVIVPSRVFRELFTLKEEEETLHMSIAEEQNQLVFEQKNIVLIGRVIDAEFPNFERIIPTEYSARIFFDREELLKAVKICSIFAKEGANIIKLSLKKHGFLVSAQTVSVGENSVEVDGKLEGEENEIAFNARYLLDALTNIPESNLSFEMTGPLNPGVFKIQGDESFLHLIMPIKV